MDYRKCSDFASLAASLKGLKGDKLKRSSSDIKDVEASNPDTSIENEDSGRVGTEDSKTTSSIDDARRTTYSFPLKSSVKLTFHQKPLTSIDMTSSGSIMVVGSQDGSYSMWNFGLMTHTRLPQKQVNVSESGLRKVLLDPLGEYLVTLSKTPAPLLFSTATGKVTAEFAKGDKYVMDARRTTGHTDTIDSVIWTPDSLRIITGGVDGTIRWWSVEAGGPNERVHIVQRERAGPNTMSQKPRVGCMTWVNREELLFGVDDGSIRLLDLKSPAMGEQTIAKLPERGSLASLLVLEETRIVTRNSEHVYLYDMRNPGKPLATHKCPMAHPETTLAIGPELIIAPSNHHKRDNTAGQIHLLDASTLDLIGLVDTDCIDALWHPTLNQLFCAGMDGSVVVHYERGVSSKGILLPLSLPAPNEANRRKECIAEYDDRTGITYAPLAASGNEADEAILSDLQRLADPRAHSRLHARLDPVTSHRPMLPLQGAGSAGRIGRGPNAAIMQQLMGGNGGPDLLSPRLQDPREALLSMDEKARQDPRFVAPAYAETQPQPVFDYSALEAERQREEERARKQQRRK